MLHFQRINYASDQYVVWREDDQYVSHCLNVEVASCGDTREEAIDNLKEAVELYFEDGEYLEFTNVESVETCTALIDA
jgi:predicted RNase H-like HicB family nuclease